MRFIIFLLGCGCAVASGADETPQLKPWETSALTVETGMLWEVGNLTPISYRLVPTQLSWRSKEFIGRVFADGSRLMIRHRVALIGTWVQHGPESHYAGFSVSPSVEWWDAAGRWSLFTGSGGGLGWIDSRGVAGGQGQDFTFNWFIRGGVEYVTARNLRLSTGIMYQHLSNGGQTDPNPGIDGLGFTVGYSWAF
ncbi:MAG TPA: acyloxyacyl hydrolase [Lacunisphaera sp.]|nr:acyloxyacyl hydrolase [Lacunisphaera sp.]